MKPEDFDRLVDIELKKRIDIQVLNKLEQIRKENKQNSWNIIIGNAVSSALSKTR